MLLLLHPHHNFHPLHNLPGEVLALVLLSYIEGSLYDFSDLRARRTSSIIPGAYPWLRIRHVCRYWRDVSLQYQFLNAHIVLVDPADVVQQIRRSGRYPLSIYTAHGGASLSPEALLESFRIIFREASRIHSIFLRYDTSIHAALQSPDFATLDLPNARSLALQFIGDKRMLDQYAETPFHRMQLSGLDSYACDNCALSSLVSMLQDKPFRDCLRSLEIRHAWRWPPGNAHSEADELAAILGRFQSLEQLSIDTEFDIKPPSPYHARLVDLPHLRSLVLYDGATPHATSTWLPRIIAPTTTYITIESCYREFVDPEAISLAVSERFTGGGGRCHRIGTPSVVELDVDIGHRSSIELKFWTMDQVSNVCGELDQPPDPLIRWVISVDGGDEPVCGIVSFLRKIIETLPLFRTSGLLLRDRSRRDDLSPSRVNIVETLRSLKDVCVLCADGHWISDDVLEAMERPLLKDHIFPNLQRLHLREDHKLGTFFAPLERIGRMIVYRRGEQHNLRELKLEVHRWRIRHAEDWRGEAFLLSQEVTRCLERLTYAFMTPMASRDVGLLAELMMLTRKARDPKPSTRARRLIPPIPRP